MRFVFLSGFSMFTMFFGSGNLVFPLNLGLKYQHSSISALLGLLVTAVLVPFLGLLALMFSNGDYKKFFSPLGKTITFLIVAASLSLMGPFGVVPRCMWVAYGGVEVMGFSYPFWVFALIFLSLLMMMSWNKNKIMDIVAYILTPFKFGSIAFLIIVSFWKSKGIQSFEWSKEAFSEGLYDGYQMMDLIASLFFACTIFNYIKSKKLSAPQSDIIKLSMKASCVGGGLLALVYICFVFIGSSYASFLQGIEPQNILPTIAKNVLGEWGLGFVAFTIALSCLATSTVLVDLFVDFIKKDIFKERLSHKVCLVLTVSLAFFLSLFGFKAICGFLGGFLSKIYPLIIVYVVYQMITLSKQFSPPQIHKK